MNTAELEAMNKQRIALGMKPLPVPGAAADSDSDSSNSDSDEAGSTLEKREEKAFENYQKLQAEKGAKKRRQQQAEAIRKAREKAQRFQQLQGKGLGEATEDAHVDAKAWLVGQKKRQKKIEKARKLEEEKAEEEARAAAAIQYTSKDLAGIKVAHDMSTILDGDEQILTLKDTAIDGSEESGDELENLELRAEEKLKEKLELKKKKPDYNPLDGDESQGLLSKYDEEIYGKQMKRFTLDGKGAIADLTDILGDATPKADQGHVVDLDLMGMTSLSLRKCGICLTISAEDVPKSSDYRAISGIRVKKPKKKKSKSSRKKPLDDDDILFPKSESEDEKMDLDSNHAVLRRTAQDASLIDDDDLQSALMKQRQAALKKRKRVKPEDLARQIRSQEEPEEDDNAGTGLVIAQVSEFVANIKEDDEDEPKPKRRKTPEKPSVTTMDEDEDGDHPMDNFNPTAEEHTLRMKTENQEEVADEEEDEVLNEKPVSQGVGAALALLRDRGIVRDSHASELQATHRQKEHFLSMKAKMRVDQEESARNQRERDRQTGRMERMGVHSHRDQQDWAADQNKKRDLAHSREMARLYTTAYKPTFEIKYTDDYGRSLGPKEAFKHMSHQFHGKGSGKGKMDKQLKKIAEEKRKESQSVLDASQSVGMSSVVQQQHKKRKEAGVRIA
jgi:U4/U6.U5 tri-snRNP-associated protein 1